jgi:trimethylamine--corrinoid protein Co-methyltransferase
MEERANALCRSWLEAYEAPPLDPAVDEALLDFMRKRKDSMADAFT